MRFLYCAPILLSACGNTQDCDVKFSPAFTIHLYEESGEPLFQFPAYPEDDSATPASLSTWHDEVEDLQNRMLDSVDIEYVHSSGVQGKASFFSDAWWVSEEGTGVYELSVVYHERLENGCSKIATAAEVVRIRGARKGCSNRSKTIYIPLDVIEMCP